jgi:hypothetical protein
MLLKITSVDMNGFCGRDFHPSESDNGLVVLVVGAHVMYSDAEGDLHNLMTGGRLLNRPVDEEADKAIAFAIDDSDAAVVTTMWTCVTKDGRVLELLDHEVEMFRS